MSVLPSGKPSFSYSAIEKYLKCGHLYFLHYLDKMTPRPEGSSDARMIGGVVHEVLETVYTKMDAPAPVYLERYWRSFFRRIEMPQLYGAVQEYNNDWNILLTKATADYTGDDAIRTGEGKVPKHPTMTRGWNDAIVEANMDKKKSLIDEAVGKAVPDYQGASVVDVMRESQKILENFEPP